MIKKILAIILISIMSLSIVACGAEKSSNLKTELVNNDENEVVEEIVNDTEKEYPYSDEYWAAFNERNYCRCTNVTIKVDNREVECFSSWKEGYKALIEYLNKYSNSMEYALIYVNEDDIPELVYRNATGEMAIVTFNHGSLEQYLGMYDGELSYVEKANVIYFHEKMHSEYYDYVLSIAEGYWTKIACGVRVEDSVDENGKPIISYWNINKVELTSDSAYYTELEKYYNFAYGTDSANITYLSTDDVILQIDLL